MDDVGAQHGRALLMTAEHSAAYEQELSRLRAAVDRGSNQHVRTASTDAESAARELAITAARIVELESLLRRAHVLPDSAPMIVAVGVEVEVLYLTKNRTMTYGVSAASLPPRGSVSLHSPIGQALMGCSVGEEVTVQLPDGRDETLRVTAITAMPNLAARPGGSQQA